MSSNTFTSMELRTTFGSTGLDALNQIKWELTTPLSHYNLLFIIRNNLFTQKIITAHVLWVRLSVRH